MFVFFATSIDHAQTMQSSIDTLTSLRLALTIIFIFTFVAGLLNLLFYLMIKHSADLTFNFLIPRLYFGRKNIKFEIEDNLARPLNFTRLTVFKNEKIYKTYYFLSSKYSIFLPGGDFQATVSKFGHSAQSTNTFKVGKNKLSFALTLNKTQEVRPAKSIAVLAKTTMGANTIIALTWLITLANTYILITLPLQIISIALIVFPAYLTYRFFSIAKAVRLVDFKNRPLTNKKIEISNKFSEPIEQLQTNEKGLLYIMISPGIYKFIPEDHIHRTVRVNETGFGYFKIKF